jgi:HlyD family type I secretion membrane fusion protein
MQRIIISAPMSGIITDLQVHTISGVIRPGEKILDIVPLDELVVQAMVMPQDIDVIEAGQEARVRLTAYKARNVPPLDGEVVSVSADRFENPNNGQSYYLARVKIKDTELADHKEIRLTPGMPADVLIITGERSMVSYLLSPITDSIHKAFREQ